MMRLTLVNLRIMMGKKNPKSAETVGGSTPDTKLNESELSSCHFSRKGTQAVSYGRVIS